MISSHLLTNFKKIQVRATIGDLLDDITEPHCRLSSAESFRIVFIQKTRRAKMLQHSSLSSEDLGHCVSYEQHDLDDRILGESECFRGEPIC